MSEVFISYRQTNDEELKRVRAFGERLRDCGVDVVLDQFFLEINPAGPNEGWPQWSETQASKTEYILIVGTEPWFHWFEANQQPGYGLGSASETRVIRQRIYDARGVIDNIRIVLFDDVDAASISIELRGYHRFHADRDFEKIVRWLGGLTTNPTLTPSSGVQSADQEDAATTIPDLVKNFYGNDPIVGEDAANELLNELGSDAIKVLVPVDSGLYIYSSQIDLRLKRVASTLGNQIVSHLVHAISSAPWGTKMRPPFASPDSSLQMKLKSR